MQERIAVVSMRYQAFFLDAYVHTEWNTICTVTRRFTSSYYNGHSSAATQESPASRLSDSAIHELEKHRYEVGCPYALEFPVDRSTAFLVQKMVRCRNLVF